MRLLILITTADPDDAAWARWLQDVMTSWPGQLLILLLFAGLVTILILADIASIPEDIYESARIDGASGWKIDWYFTLPLVRNTIGTSVILAATSMLKEFELIYMTTNGGPGIATLNLPLLIYKKALIEQNYGLANAMGVVTIAIGVLLIVLVNRHLLSSRFEST